MARIIGGIGTTHVPAIGKAIAQGKQNDPYWKPFFSGFHAVHKWLAREQPDIAVVFSNDHGLNFFLDKLPTFAVGAANEYRNEDEGWGIPVAHAAHGRRGALLAPDRRAGARRLRHHDVPGDAGRSRGDDSAQPDVADGRLAARSCRSRSTPCSIRCPRWRAASSSAARSAARSRAYPQDLKVLMIGTGGLSHQLDGKRAGFINKDFDTLCMDQLSADPEALTRYSIPQLVELAGAQGVEFLNWMAMRGALTGTVSELHRNYHIPISNTRRNVLFETGRADGARRRDAIGARRFEAGSAAPSGAQGSDRGIALRRASRHAGGAAPRNHSG